MTSKVMGLRHDPKVPRRDTLSFLDLRHTIHFATYPRHLHQTHLDDGQPPTRYYKSPLLRSPYVERTLCEYRLFLITLLTSNIDKPYPLHQSDIQTCSCSAMNTQAQRMEIGDSKGDQECLRLRARQLLHPRFTPI